MGAPFRAMATSVPLIWQREELNILILSCLPSTVHLISPGSICIATTAETPKIVIATWALTGPAARWPSTIFWMTIPSELFLLLDAEVPRIDLKS